MRYVHQCLVTGCSLVAIAALILVVPYTVYGSKMKGINYAVGNASLGEGALTNNTGDDNTAIGGNALHKNTTGSGNTAIGYQAGGSNISGSHNVFIGYRAGDNNLFKLGSNRLVIANGSGPNDPLILGYFDKHRLEVRGSLIVSSYLLAKGTLTVKGSIKAKEVITTGSDARLKKDIKPLTHALDSILQLEGKTYRWKEDTVSNNKDIGLIAQDVERILPELVAEDEQGYKGIAYSKLTAVLIEAIKEQQGQMTTQQDQIASLEKENAQFTGQIASLEKENTQLKTIMAEQMNALLARVAMLEGESLAAN